MYHALTFVAFCRAEQLGLDPVLTPRVFGLIPHLTAGELEGEENGEEWEEGEKEGGNGSGAGPEWQRSLAAQQSRGSRRGVEWEQAATDGGDTDGAGGGRRQSLHRGESSHSHTLATDRHVLGATAPASATASESGHAATHRDPGGDPTRQGASRLGHHAQSSETNVVRVSTREQVERLVDTTQAVVEGHRVGILRTQERLGEAIVELERVKQVEMAALAARVALLERDCEASLGELEFVYTCQQEKCKAHYRTLIAEERTRTELGIKGQAEGAREEQRRPSRLARTFAVLPS